MVWQVIANPVSNGMYATYVVADNISHDSSSTATKFQFEGKYLDVLSLTLNLDTTKKELNDTWVICIVQPTCKYS